MKNTAHAPAKLTIWNKTFICLFMAQAFMSLSQGSVNILVARYATESLNVSAVTMGNLVGLYFGVALAMRPIAGPLQAKLDKKRLLLAVYFTGGIVNLGYALFNTTSAFIVFRVIQGIQYSFMGSLTMILAVDSLPREKVASGVAMYGLGGTVMQTIAPNIGLFLRDLGPQVMEGPAGVTLGYKFAFFFAAAVLSIAVIPVFMIPKIKEAKEKIASTGAWYKNIISKHAIPMTIVLILSSIASSGYRSYIDAFAKEAGDAFMQKYIGLFPTVTAIVLLVTRPFSGRIMDRYSMKKVLPIAMVVLAASLVIISGSKTLPVILIGGALASIGSGFVHPGMQALCIQTEPPSKRAVASNTLFAGIDLGGYLGPLWGGFVVSQFNYSTAILSGLLPLAASMILFFIFIPGFTRRKSELESLSS